MSTTAVLAVILQNQAVSHATQAGGLRTASGNTFWRTVGPPASPPDHAGASTSTGESSNKVRPSDHARRSRHRRRAEEADPQTAGRLEPSSPALDRERTPA
jgi:hypothetical protein